MVSLTASGLPNTMWRTVSGWVTGRGRRNCADRWADRAVDAFAPDRVLVVMLDLAFGSGFGRHASQESANAQP